MIHRVSQAALRHGGRAEVATYTHATDPYRHPITGLVGEEDAKNTSTSKIQSWDSFARDKRLLLDAYRPERFPVPGDWVPVLETSGSRLSSHWRIK
jgi:hypothetical protein